MKLKFRGILLTSILAIAGIFGVSSALINKQTNEQPVAEKAEADHESDFSKTIRVLADLSAWGGYISSVQIAGSGAVSCNAYGCTWGFDVISNTNYDKMSLTFWEDSHYCWYNGDEAWFPRPSGVFEKGHIYKLYPTWARDDGNNKRFNVAVSDLGVIPEPNTAKIYAKKYAWSKEGAYTWESIYGHEYNFNGSFDSVSSSALTGVTIDGDDEVVVISIKYQDINSLRWMLTDGTDSNKSNTQEGVTSGAFYEFGGGAGELSIDADKGAALSVIETICSGLGNATVAGKAVTNSICAITSGSSIIGAYGELGDDAKEYFDGATLYTYTPGSTSTKSNVSFSSIINQLSKNLPRGLSGLLFSFSPLKLFSEENGGATTIIIIAASSVALLSVTALSVLVLKKRKNKEE